MAARTRLWRVIVRSSSGNLKEHHITTKTNNLSVMAKEVDKLIVKINKDMATITPFYRSSATFVSVHYLGIVGE